MAERGHDTLIVWQRGAGTFDRVGDVYWLTNFVMNGSGQDPASDEMGAPYTFCAVLMRRGLEPELTWDCRRAIWNCRRWCAARQ